MICRTRGKYPAPQSSSPCQPGSGARGCDPSATQQELIPGPPTAGTISEGECSAAQVLPCEASFADSCLSFSIIASNSFRITKSCDTVSVLPRKASSSINSLKYAIIADTLTTHSSRTALCHGCNPSSDLIRWHTKLSVFLAFS